MDAVQLNKINELAREYLRLGIARNTTDAVEKARFQLSFEQKKEKNNEENAFESFFEKMKEENKTNEENELKSEEINKDILGIQPKKDEYEKKIKLLEDSIKNLENQYVQIIDSQNSKIAMLENEVLVLKQELKLIKEQGLKNNIQKENEQRKLFETPNEKKGISKTIEQTIKGRKITAEEVAVDKIFYFGNK